MIQRLILTILLAGQYFHSVAQTELSADDILNKSIEFCGSATDLSKIKSSSLAYDLTMGDGSHASVIVKREISQKYVRSVLSDKHVPSSMHYNGSSLTIIDGENKKVIADSNLIEEIKLQTYNHIQIGYKELSYSLKRLEDQKFNYFDCYVVSATANNGYSTLNYFDKKNFRLIMIIYPKGNKSLLTDYIFKDSVLVNSKIISIEQNSERMIWELKKINNNISINSLWFNVEMSNSTSLPEDVKIGTFVSSNSTLINRTKSTQTEQNGNFNSKLNLAWFNNYTFAMVDNKSINKREPLKAVDKILVKIVSWDDNRYVCHYFTKGVSGTEEYIMKK